VIECSVNIYYAGHLDFLPENGV